MNTAEIRRIAKAMVAKPKGILAADESNSTAGKRLASIQTESTEETRRQYRDLFLSADGIENYLSGVILYDETIRQNASNGKSFVQVLQKKGIIPGIKVDMGLQDMPNFPGETYTQGLDGLRERLAEYYALGARFTKWRTVITIGKGIPTEAAIHTNAHGMALYAALVQEANMVPMVEPEVLIDGNHTIEQSYEATTKTLKTLFQLLQYFQVDLPGVILKTSMVISGKECPQKATPEQIGKMTVQCLLESVPTEVGGIVFLSGGQTAEESTLNLNAINVAAKEKTPWELTFSYARALQGPSLNIWAGKDKNIPAARDKFIERIAANSAARMGEYDVNRIHESLNRFEPNLLRHQDNKHARA